jgi:hypothetical protein
MNEIPGPKYHNVRWVVCAAIKNKVNGRIICGPRHFDQTMRNTIENEKDFAGWPTCNWKSAVQGFIDQGGVFMTRNEAHELLKVNGQPIHNPLSTKPNAIVFSEDLY